MKNTEFKKQLAQITFERNLFLDKTGNELDKDIYNDIPKLVEMLRKTIVQTDLFIKRYDDLGALCRSEQLLMIAHEKKVVIKLKGMLTPLLKEADECILLKQHEKILAAQMVMQIKNKQYS